MTTKTVLRTLFLLLLLACAAQAQSIIGIFPSQVTANGPAFTLEVDGFFNTGSQVCWTPANGPTQRLTAGLFSGSSFQFLLATVPATFIQSTAASPVRIEVASSSTAPCAGQPQTLTILPAPVITSFSPTGVPAGSQATTVTVDGSNFQETHTVYFDGVMLSAVSVTSSRIVATIPAFLLATARNVPMFVDETSFESFASVQKRRAAASGVRFASNTVNFPVTMQLNSVTPNSVAAGSASTNISVAAFGGFESNRQILFNGTPLSTTISSATSATATIPSTLLVNPGTANITYVSAAGITSNALAFNITGNPVIETISPRFRDAGSGAFTLTVTGGGFAAGSTVFFNGQARSTTVVNSNQVTAQILANDILTPGIVPVVVNTAGVNSQPFSFEILTPLTITSLNPSSANAGSGAFTLTVNGTGFESGNTVLWNGQSRTTTFVSATQMTAAIQAADVANAGSFPVTVAGRFSRVSNAANFLVNQPGSLTSLNPPFRDAGSGAFTLTVNGSNFLSGATVLWNGQSRTTTFVSATQLTAAITAADVQNAGTAQVSVTQSNTTTNSLTFEILTPLTITSLNPSSANAGSGAFTLTVNGTGFESGNTVLWNGQARTTTFVSATQMTAAIQAADVANAGSFPVTVAGRFSRVSNAANFTVNQPGNLISLNPSFRDAGSGAFTLTVNGSNFLSGATVLWNGQSRTTTFVSATQLTAAITAADVQNAGTAQVSVSQANSTVGPLTFEILTPLTITSLNPSFVTVGSAAFVLTVNGTGFDNTAVVEFNGAALSTTFVNAGQLTATVPATAVANVATIPVRVRGRLSRVSNTSNFIVAGGIILTSIAPSAVEAGAAQFTLTATGQNFGRECQILFNGSALPTNCVSETSATATVAAALVAQPGTASITVRDTFQRVSNPQTLTIQERLTLTSLNPVEAGAGSTEFELVVNGAGFVAGTRVRVAGTDLPTTVDNATRLRTRMPAAAMILPGALAVQAVTPDNRLSNTLNFTVRAAPQITSIDPSSSRQDSPAITMTVNGANFLASSVVTFNGVNLPTTFVDAGRLTVQVNATLLETAGSAQVVVVNPIGSRSNAASFGIASSLVLSAINPSNADAGGPEFVMTLSGAAFQGGASVTIGGASVPTTFVSGNQLTARVPASVIAQPGSFEVVVTNPNGQRSNPVTFAVRAAPRITSVNPNVLTANGPAVVLAVTGTGFVSGAVVRWDGSALPTRFGSATALSADLGAGVTRRPPSGSVTVVNPDGTVSNAVTVEVVELTLRSVNPAAGQVNSPGVTVNLTGTGFLPGATVLLDGSGATATVNSRTSITAEIPASAMTTVRDIAVTVRNPDGAVSGAVTFSVVNGVSLTAVSPSQFRVGAGDTDVAASGSGFERGSVLELNGSGLSTEFVSATSLRAVVPANALRQAGRLIFRVRNPNNVLSNDVTGEVAAIPLQLSSISPANVNLNGPAFTLRATGSGFSRSTVLNFRGTALATTVLSDSSLEASVPAALIAAAAFPGIPGEGQDAAITAVDGAATSNALNLRVAPALTLTSVNPNSAVAGAAATTITVDGSGFAQGLTVVFDGSALPTTLVSATRATAVVPANLLSTARTVGVAVRNAAGATAGPVTFTVNPAVQLPPVTVVVPVQVTGGSAQIGISLGAASPADLSGTLELIFTPADSSLPATYSDPALQFLAGGRTLTFTIARGATNAVLPQDGRLNLGTVAGTILIRITRLVAGTQNVLPSPEPFARITIPNAVPSITPGSVRIIPTASGFDVEVIGSSNTRQITRATLTFQVSGAVDGDSTFTIDVTQIFNAYFASTAGLANGGAFRLRIPFTLSGGDASAITSVSVTLTNSVGVSVAVSGGR